MTTRKNLPASRSGLRRRTVLGGLAAGLAAPTVFTRPARAANEQVIVRTPGGAYDDIRRELIYKPFEEKTGIRVVPVAATAAKMLAMFKAGNVELDVIDTGDDPLIQLNATGALMQIPYDEFAFTDPNDLNPDFKRDYLVGNFIYAQVLGYNTQVYNAESAPKSWAEFWDAGAFPGARTLADMGSGSPNLEFALIADGVSKDALYPLDIDRAFESLSRIRPNITKFWDSGALATQIMVDHEVDLGAIWHTRITNAIQNGAELGIQWNEHMLQVQAYSIAKDTPNREAAVKFVDFCCSPDIQSAFCQKWNCGPVNNKAFETFSQDMIERAPGSPALAEKGFTLDAEWWAENRQTVSNKWSTWILKG